MKLILTLLTTGAEVPSKESETKLVNEFEDFYTHFGQRDDGYTMQ